MFMDTNRLPPADGSKSSGETLRAGLPVSGYRPRSKGSVNLVNEFKALEEKVLRHLDDLKDDTHEVLPDQRWLAIGRTAIEQGFMAVNRSVFKPARVSLDGDQL
jgi:hypothetical protein